MIYGADRELIPGMTIVPDFITDSNGDDQPGQPVSVVREATREEWIAYCIEISGHRPYGEDAELWFYEIRTERASIPPRHGGTLKTG